ncbi:MAG TPA: ATP-binding protein [Candidatus Binatia bacterium]|nr:ATP-binding protein [Candidatus Binatia bacterium]
MRMSIGFIVSGMLFAWVFSREYRTLLRSEFQKRGETLVRGLAASARLDVRAGNRERLAHLAESVREEADVVAASIYDARHEVMAQTEKIPGALAERPPAVPGSIAVEARTLPDGARALSFLAPVEVEVEAGRGADESPERLGGATGRPVRTEAVGAIEVVFHLGALERRIAETQATTMEITAAIVASGIVLVLWLSRGLVPPIERMPSAALAEGEEEPRGVNQSLERKVRERTAELERKQAELIAANAELERASRSKSEFLATMSHELRTPLQAVNGFSELLLEQRHGPLVPKQQRYVENILAGGKHLLRLVNDLLDLSKIEAGRMDLRLEEFSLRRTIEGAVDVIQPLAQKKGLAIDVRIDPGLDHVRLDEGKTKQVLYNLMSNAVKFTDAGKITISAAREAPVGGWVEVTVADTGIGIRPDDQKRIFREFEQVDGTHPRQYEGTGLGLALTRRLVELQGGSIRLESELGRGSRFVVRLPVSPDAAAPRDGGEGA